MRDASRVLGVKERQEIRDLMKRHGVSQQTLANHLDVDRTTLYRWLSGQPVRETVLVELSTFLGKPRDWLARQFELLLDERFVAKTSPALHAEFEQLSRDIGKLHGFRFHAFVGVQVEGSTRKSYRRFFALHPSKADAVAVER
jgi:transcriptional regulator with XRE-family HTH domain